MKALNTLKVGKSAVIKAVHGNNAFARRLMDMGLTPGCKISVKRIAPLGDPIVIEIYSYSLFLRMSDAKMIEIE